MEKFKLTAEQEDRIIQMAWEDRTPFEAIYAQFGLKEKDVISLMRSCMRTSSFNLWSKRTNGRATKHGKKYKLLAQDSNLAGKEKSPIIK